MPNAPETPANNPHCNEERGGTGSLVSHANSSINSKPQACAPATTRKTLARLVATPPAKSPPPQTAAAPRLRVAAVRVAGFMNAVSSFEFQVSSKNTSSHLVLAGSSALPSRRNRELQSPN